MENALITVSISLQLIWREFLAGFPRLQLSRGSHWEEERKRDATVKDNSQVAGKYRAALEGWAATHTPSPPPRAPRASAVPPRPPLPSPGSRRPGTGPGSPMGKPPRRAPFGTSSPEGAPRRTVLPPAVDPKGALGSPRPFPKRVVAAFLPRALPSRSGGQPLCARPATGLEAGAFLIKNASKQIIFFLNKTSRFLPSIYIPSSYCLPPHHHHQNNLN